MEAWDVMSRVREQAGTILVQGCVGDKSEGIMRPSSGLIAAEYRNSITFALISTSQPSNGRSVEITHRAKA